MRVIFLILISVCSAFAGDISYNKDVRPILSNKCFGCHGSDEKHAEGNLQLNTFANATKAQGKKKDRFAIVPGNLKKSELWARINTDTDEIMPPVKINKKLSLKEKEILRKWILSGAKYEKHWSSQEIIKPEIPKEQ